jgi:hypothetical protein
MAARLAAQQIETAVRSWRLITAACDASAVRRRRRLWRLCPASNRGCLSYLDQDWVPGFVLPGCTAELNRRALAIDYLFFTGGK